MMGVKDGIARSISWSQRVALQAARPPSLRPVEEVHGRRCVRRPPSPSLHVRGIGIVRYEAVAIGAVPGEGDEDDIIEATRREAGLELLTNRETCRVLVEKQNRVVFAQGVSKETVKSRGVAGTARLHLHTTPPP